MTAPVGLCGLFSHRTLVRGVSARSRSSKIQMETALRPKRHIDDGGAGSTGDRFVGGIHRFRHDHLVAGTGEALQRAVEPGLGAGDQHHIVGGVGWPVRA